MTLRDLINNEQGEAYVVSKSTYKVKKIACAFLNKREIEKRYNQWWNVGQNFNLVVFAKTKKTYLGYRDANYAIPSYYLRFLNCDDIDLDKTSFTKYGHFFTVSKDEAYNYTKTRLREKIQEANSLLKKMQMNFGEIKDGEETQTFKDLINNDEGKAYLVSIKTPNKIREISCTIGSYNRITERYEQYADQLGYWVVGGGRVNKRIFIRLSPKTKKMVNITYWSKPFIFIDNNMLDKNVIQYQNYYIFLSKQDAYDYVSQKIFQRKQKIHDKIVKSLEEKFNIKKSNGK